MPVFLCRWQNGDFSVVHAPDKDRAIELLYEAVGADARALTPINDFMVHFVLDEEGEMVLQEFGELPPQNIRQIAYPELDKALENAPRDGAGYLTEEGRKTVQQAVARERERLKERVN